MSQNRNMMDSIIGTEPNIVKAQFIITATRIYTLEFDQNIEMSASDCVYLISSLLEYPFDSINDIEVDGGRIQ